MLEHRAAAVAAVFGLAALLSSPAQAGLIGSGGTVQVNFTAYTLGLAQPPVAYPASALTPTDPANVVEPQPLTMTQAFIEATSDSTMTVANTTLTILSLYSPPAPFCFSTNGLSGSACPDPQATFTFLFTGVNITGASVDPASAADFQPARFGPHLGLQLVSPNEVTVDVTGENPAPNDSLIIDLAFGTTPPPPVPEPATLAILGVALSGMVAVRRNARR